MAEPPIDSQRPHRGGVLENGWGWCATTTLVVRGFVAQYVGTRRMSELENAAGPRYKLVQMHAAQASHLQGRVINGALRSVS